MWYTTLIKHLIRKKHYTLCQLVRNLLLTQINLWCHLSLGKASLGQPVIVKQAFLHICDHQDAEKLLKRLQGHVWKITHLTPVLDRWVRWKAETLLYLAQPALLHMQMKSSFLLMIACFRLLVEDCVLLWPSDTPALCMFLWTIDPTLKTLRRSAVCALPLPPLQGTCSSPLSVEELLLASLPSLWAS